MGGRARTGQLDTERRVTGRIEREELAELALALANIDSPPGQEKEVSNYIHEWLRNHGIPARQLALVSERPNVIGWLPGSGTGSTLILNAHLDTAWGPLERRWMLRPEDPVYTSGWREGDRLFGNAIVNDKGPLACALVTLKALTEEGVELAGDVVVMGVCGEIGQEPVDEFEAPQYLSKEVGTRYVVTHGVTGDYALVAENTNFGVARVEAGKAFFKLTVIGNASRYTPYVAHPPRLDDNGNAIVRASVVVGRLVEWARRYEERHTYRFEGGECVPKVNIGAIRGGQPFIPISSAEKCFIYLDVRLSPAQTAMDVRRELVAQLVTLDFPVEVECTLYRRGYEAVDADPLLEAIRHSHRAEFGRDPGGVRAGQSSGWRDTNVFNELGIPSVSYGPSAGEGGARAWTDLDDLVHAARVYARVALHLARNDKA